MQHDVHMRNVLVHYLSPHVQTLLLIGVYVVVFLSLVFPAVDNDLGWHVKYGEYAVTNRQILRKDPFSWTLPGYEWINHSWMYDIAVYGITRTLGYLGLSLIGAIIGFAAFVLLIRPYKLTYWKVGLLGMAYVLLTHTVMYAGLRSQVVSMLLLAGLLRLLLDADRAPRRLFVLPLLFLLWVNVHGNFTLGILVASVFLGSYVLRSVYLDKSPVPTALKTYALPLVLAVAATLINPFGIKAYTETLNHIGNPYLRNVIEWQPTYAGCGTCHLPAAGIYAVVVLISMVQVVRRKQWAYVPLLVLVLLLSKEAYETRRMLPLVMLLTLPLVANWAHTLRLDLDRFAITRVVALVCICIGVLYNLGNRYHLMNLYRFSEQDYCRLSTGCSPELAQMLQSDPPQGKGFTFYDWGGYLIGKGIESKLFVDGRMHVWKDRNGYQPFADFIKIYYDNDFDLFRSYEFDWVLIPDGSTLAEKIQMTDDLGAWKYAYRANGVNYFVRRDL